MSRWESQQDKGFAGELQSWNETCIGICQWQWYMPVAVAVANAYHSFEADEWSKIECTSRDNFKMEPLALAGIIW
jgi:hypothetical protein